MNKIDKLTEQQEKDLISFRNQALQIGLKTGPCDRETTERVITEFYARLEKEKPKIWFVQSPMMAQVVINILQNNLGANLWDNLRNNLGDNLLGNLLGNLMENLGDNLGANLWDNLRNNLLNNLLGNLLGNIRNNITDNLTDNLSNNLVGNLWDNLTDNLSNNLVGNLWDKLSNNLRNNLRDNLWDNLWDNLSNNLRDNLKINFVYTYLWGSLDIYWISYYLFPHVFIKPIHTPEQMKLLTLWADLANSCFFWYPFENVVFISDRPTEIHKDDRDRLHNITGPSISFSDGYSLYNYHGVAIPEKYIKDHSKITVKVIEQEENAEVRRAFIELYGTEKYLKDSNAIKLHEDATGILWKKEVPNDEDIIMVEVINASPELDGSHKHYWLRVPPTITTAQEAVAWTFRLEKETYKPIVES